MDEFFAEVEATPVLGHISVGSVEELASLLQQIASQARRPVLATIRRSDGDMLSIGLGRPYSVLTYVSASDEPPYFTSVGSELPAERVRFDYLGEPSEFGRHNAVSLEQAFESVRRFVCSRGLPLPEMVNWEEV